MLCFCYVLMLDCFGACYAVCKTFLMLSDVLVNLQQTFARLGQLFGQLCGVSGLHHDAHLGTQSCSSPMKLSLQACSNVVCSMVSDV
jgi:hypothetical protein